MALRAVRPPALPCGSLSAGHCPGRLSPRGFAARVCARGPGAQGRRVGAAGVGAAGPAGGAAGGGRGPAGGLGSQGEARGSDVAAFAAGSGADTRRSEWPGLAGWTAAERGPGLHGVGGEGGAPAAGSSALGSVGLLGASSGCPCQLPCTKSPPRLSRAPPPLGAGTAPSCGRGRWGACSSEAPHSLVGPVLPGSSPGRPEEQGGL